MGKRNEPSSYNSCAIDIHLDGFIFNFLEHSCCSVEVMKGGGDFLEALRSVTLMTLNCKGEIVFSSSD